MTTIVFDTLPKNFTQTHFPDVQSFFVHVIDNNIVTEIGELSTDDMTSEIVDAYNRSVLLSPSTRTNI